jgi:glycosyltransferase involved in cell wall biosynthesis
MKILIVGSLTDNSGSSLRNWEVANALATLGHQVSYSEPSQLNRKPLFSSVIYYPAPYFNFPFFLGFVPSFFFYSQLLLKNRFDLIIVAKPFFHSSLPVLLFGKQAIKVLDVDDLEYEYHFGLSRFLVKFTTTSCIKLFKYYSCHNNNLKSFLSRNFSIPINNILFLGQGINPLTFLQSVTNETTRDLYKKYSLKKSEVKILFFAHIGAAAAIEPIFSSLDKIIKEIKKPFKLIVVGGGSELPKYRQRINNSSLVNNVIFTDRIDFDQRHIYFSIATFAINYNLESGNEFRSPLKLREYLAAKLPVITTNIGDTHLFKKFVTIVKNEKELTSVLKKWINNPPSKNISGSNYICNQHSWTKLTSNFISQVQNISKNQD